MTTLTATRYLLTAPCTVCARPTAAASGVCDRHPKAPIGVQHKDGCTKAWNRLDGTCPRCQELAAGAPARKGWSRR
jgi:hypothetical protein